MLLASPEPLSLPSSAASHFPPMADALFSHSLSQFVVVVLIFSALPLVRAVTDASDGITLSFLIFIFYNDRIFVWGELDGFGSDWIDVDD